MSHADGGGGDGREENVRPGAGPGVTLSLDLGTPVQMEVKGAPSRLDSAVVGVEPGEYLILRLPPPAQLAHVRGVLYPGNQVTVRYFHRGIVFGFQTRLLNQCLPLRFLLTAYPERVETRSVRRAPRSYMALPARVRVGGVERGCVVRNLSATGCRCVTLDLAGGRPEAVVGAEVLIRVRFPGTEEESAIPGVVRNGHSTPSGTSIGIEFRDLDPVVADRVARFVSLASLE